MEKIKTYVIVTVIDGDVDEVLHHISQSLKVSVAGKGGGVMFLNVPDHGCGFSLNELRARIAEVARAVIVIGDVYRDGDVVLYAD